MTKFEQKSFSVPVTAHDYDPNPKPEPPCPCCPLPAGLEHACDTQLDLHEIVNRDPRIGRGRRGGFSRWL